MKFKNYKSAVHNFAHSLQSLDYTKSGKLALNALIHLNHQGVETRVLFDFMHKTIQPLEAVTKESQTLLQDYLKWLPEHFKNHNCSIGELEKLTVIISADFKKTFPSPHKKDGKQINIETKALWKVKGRNEEMIEIVENQILSDKSLEVGIPEF